jgi:hypothetical protein
MVVRPALSTESGAVQIEIGDTPPDHVVIHTALPTN